MVLFRVARIEPWRGDKCLYPVILHWSPSHILKMKKFEAKGLTLKITKLLGITGRILTHFAGFRAKLHSFQVSRKIKNLKFPG